MSVSIHSRVTQLGKTSAELFTVKEPLKRDASSRPAIAMDKATWARKVKTIPPRRRSRSDGNGLPGEGENMRKGIRFTWVFPGRGHAVAVFLLLAALLIGGYSESGQAAEEFGPEITGFPLPLHWGMSREDVRAVVESHGLHLAERDRRYLQDRRYVPGQYYQWAAIKEEHLKFLNQPRFIVFSLDENDRLVKVSMKLLAPDVAVHVAEHINISATFTREFGEPHNEEEIDLGDDMGRISRFAWRLANHSFLETEVHHTRFGRKSETTAYVNLYWDGPK